MLGKLLICIAFFLTSAMAAEAIIAAEETFFTMRIVGAAMGSTVAVLFRFQRQWDLTAMAVMFFIGLVVGFIGAPFWVWLRGWDNTADAWLLASGISGAIGYGVLQIIYSRKVASIIRSKIADE